MIIKKVKYFAIALIASLTLVACNSRSGNDKAADAANSAPEIGDHLSNDLVCMINDVYMGVPQTEVVYEDKTYYVSCDMCEERIPKEKEARIAIDPYTLKDVDKADAYIVLIGEQGQVAYFENEQNYRELMAKSDRAKEQNLKRNNRNL